MVKRLNTDENLPLLFINKTLIDSLELYRHVMYVSYKQSRIEVCTRQNSIKRKKGFVMLMLNVMCSVKAVSKCSPRNERK